MSEHIDGVIAEVVGQVAKLQDFLKALHAFRDGQLGAAMAVPTVPCGTKRSMEPAGEKPVQAVPEMVLEAAQRLTQKTPGCVFDQKTLVVMAGELHPAHYTRIKQGIYSAITSLKKRGALKLAPGGFQLTAGGTVKPGEPSAKEKAYGEMRSTISVPRDADAGRE